MDEPSGPPALELSLYPHVLISFFFLLFDVGISIALNLSLSRSLLTSAIRCLVQLQVMSKLLSTIFKANNLFLVILLATILNLLAAQEVVFNKAKRRYSGMFAVTICSLIVSTVPISAVTSRFAMGVQPWWTPERFVPALGMILGNAISGIGIGVSFTLESFHSSKDKVETLIAHGASRSEACRPVAVEALRLALLPVINQMSVIGLISIPGMMTGSILGGASVEQAALLQSIIIFTISSSTALSTLCAVISTCGVMVDKRGRVRSERSWSVGKEKGLLNALVKNGLSSWNWIRRNSRVGEVRLD